MALDEQPVLLTLQTVGTRNHWSGWHDDGSGYAVVTGDDYQSRDDSRTYHIAPAATGWIAREFIGQPHNLREPFDQPVATFRAQHTASRAEAHQLISRWAIEFQPKVGQ